MAQKTCYAAGKNKEFILEVLRNVVGEMRSDEPDKTIKVLEIASGTGEHANLFASSISGLHYQPTEPDLSMHESIAAWTASATSTSRVNPPLPLDVTSSDATSLLPEDFAKNNVDVMICINMIHISPFHCTEALFRLAAGCLRPGGCLLTYGPYRVEGHMVESNVAFDQSLKARNPEWGVRDLEAVAEVAAREGVPLRRTVAMPANNLSVLFYKV